MNDEEILNSLGNWYERPFSAEIAPCQEGPQFLDLVEWARSDKALSADEAVHVQNCPRCMRTIESIRWELADLAETGVETEPATPEPLARALRPKPTILLFGQAKRAALRIGGLAIAASVLIGFLLIWSRPGGGLAIAQELQEVGFAPALPFAGIWLDPDDEAALREAEQAVAEADVALQVALAIGDRNVIDPWIPWTKLYRNLRALGRWDQALAEMHDALVFAKEENAKPERYTFYEMCLTDLGETHQAICDYETALAYHRQSFEAARDYQLWFHESGRSTDRRPHALELDLAATLAPRLWLLSALATAQGNTELAWDYHNQAGDLLTDFFRKECQYRSLDARQDASLVDLSRLIVADGDEGLESPVVKVREHLLYRARLLRIGRDLDSAERTLGVAKTLPDYPFADESRLDFNEPLEELRIAIARGDFATALAAADEAERHTGPRHFEGRPSHAPIGVLARAALQFLRGVALAGLDPKDSEALRLIESAIQAVQQSAASLQGTRQDKFLERFDEWNRVADRIRGEVFPEREGS